MKTIYKVMITLVIILYMVACEKSPVDPGNNKIPVDKSTEELIKSDNEFGIDLYKKLLAYQEDGSNVILSPLSAAFALAMTYNGADGTTKTAMEESLKKEGFTTEEINEIYKNLMNGLMSVDNNVTLNIANSIWYRDNFYVEQEFINTNQNYYDAEVRALDFGNTSAKDIINSWVEEKTNDKIKDIIQQISPNTVMFLINAIYFNGIWTYEFDKESTTDGDFYLADGSIIQVPTMYLEEELMYSENELFSSVELFYGAGNYSMIILLPDHGKSTDDIVDQLTSEDWESWNNSYTEEEVVVGLPKFKFEFEDSLNNPLIDMGMGVAFNPDEADFSKINPGQDIFISMVKQKAYIDVNEKGTEAAAATVVEMELTAMPGGKKYFTVNRPFMFVIKEKDTNAIIFIGRVMQPEYKE
ncbi:MAG: serpin family protein [Bacteroidales bacterium]|nr:MAG: serpin family protein [Bacteroidales bacterium]